MIACPSQTKAPEQHNAVLTPTCCTNAWLNPDYSESSVSQWCLPDCSGCGDNQSGYPWYVADDPSACGSESDPHNWEYPKTCLKPDNGGIPVLGEPSCYGNKLTCDPNLPATDKNSCYQMCYSNCGTLKTVSNDATLKSQYFLPYCSYSNGQANCPSVYLYDDGVTQHPWCECVSNE